MRLTGFIFKQITLMNIGAIISRPISQMLGDEAVEEEEVDHSGGGRSYQSRRGSGGRR
jgi:hypothetical protein